jgi:hypothetical protein
MFLQFNYIPRMKRERGTWVKQNIKAAAQATLGYNAHRVDKEKQRMERILFGNGGLLTEEQAMRTIDEASKKIYFFRMILNPDPKTEDRDKNTDLWKLTKELVQWLEQTLEREIPFIAAEHDDHTDLKHIHAILLIERVGREKMITVPIINQMRELASGRALQQQQGREQVLAHQQDRHRAVALPPVPKRSHALPPRRQENFRETATQPLDLITCGDCGNMQSPHTKDGWWKCMSCGRELVRGREEGLSR